MIVKASLLVGLLVLLGGCVHQRPVVAVAPTPAPQVIALPPLGNAVAAAQANPLLGSPVIGVTNPTPGFTSTVFAAIPGTLPPGPGVLGFISPLGQYLALGLDASVELDTVSHAYPVLKVPQNPVLANPPVTYRATFLLQFDGTWTAAATFNGALPNLVALIQVYRNGLLQGDGDIRAITYSSGTLVITPTVAWQPGDSVRGVWVL